jgi:hypothetical protein
VLFTVRDDFSRPGEYSGDGLYWHDQKTGTLYHVHATQIEECEIRACDLGLRRCRSVLSWLARAPAIIGWRFDAVTEDTAQVAGSVSFCRHARRGVHHLDDLDPQTAAPETMDKIESPVWAGDHQRATTAFARLEENLRAHGWQQHRQSGAHWYSRRYLRPVILWDQPVHATELPPRF